ncbi:MAG: hypothetical protein ACYDA6_00150 [Solirubrobacteraceae bacterium]
MVSEFSVHDEPDFERTYDEDDEITIRRGDLRALLDLATSSMDFGSGFWDNEQVEIARKIAGVLGVDPLIVTPPNFTFDYVCKAKGQHKWRAVDWRNSVKWICEICRHTTTDFEMPPGLLADET